jgi:hypothetical protein
MYIYHPINKLTISETITINEFSYPEVESTYTDIIVPVISITYVITRAFSSGVELVETLNEESLTKEFSIISGTGASIVTSQGDLQWSENTGTEDREVTVLLKVKGESITTVAKQKAKEFRGVLELNVMVGKVAYTDRGFLDVNEVHEVLLFVIYGKFTGNT